MPMRVGMPYIHVSNALPFDYSGHTPLYLYGWPHEMTSAALTRNREGVARFAGFLAEVNTTRGPFLNQSLWARQSPMKFPASEAGGLHHKLKTELNRFLHECTNTTL